MSAEQNLSPLRICREPSVYLMGQMSTNQDQINTFLADNGVQWSTDTEIGGEVLAEAGGRVCYMSYGIGRKTNKAFIDHIIEVGHGSVLEHAVYSLMITGVSRSFSHELIRHRHHSYSQRSQRYVNESTSQFIEPEVIADDPVLHEIWVKAVNAARTGYDQLVAGLEQKFAEVPEKTLRRKMARQAARSVLPNATETMILVTANVRALRHFIEMRASEHAEIEIRRVAMKILRIMQAAAPNMFSDYQVVVLPDGTETAQTKHMKV